MRGIHPGYLIAFIDTDGYAFGAVERGGPRSAVVNVVAKIPKMVLFGAVSE